MSNILERLARLAKAEFNHIKTVMADRDDDAPEDVRAERLERLRRAREELERAEAELRQMRERDGASAWARDGARDRGGRRVNEGASAWATDERGPARDDGASAWARREPERARRDTPVYSEEIRLAYAALELPLGSDKDTVNKAYRELLSRYHPDKHHHNPRLQAAANELTRRIKEARDRLLAWLG